MEGRKRGTGEGRKEQGKEEHKRKAMKVNGKGKKK